MTAPGIEPVPEHHGVTGALFDLLVSQRTELATAAGTALRGSESGGCWRSIGFRVLGVEPDYQIDGKSLAAFEVGTQWHEVIQQALEQQFGADLEVTVDLRPHGWDCSLHADAVYETSTAGDWQDEPYPGAVGEGYELPTTRRVVEIKSKSQFAYSKFALGTTKPFPKQADIGEKPIGPEANDLIQAGKSAIGVEADEVHIIYVNKNKTDEISEWIIGLDDPIPYLDGRTIRDLALEDLNDQTMVLSDLQAGLVPARVIPEYDPRNHKKGWSGGLVAEPPMHRQDTGKWGTPWLCSGCTYNLTCRRLPSDAVPISDAFLTMKEPT